MYEQAAEFNRLGAGIHVAANAVKALLGLGLPQEVLAAKAFINSVSTHRQYDTGEVTREIDHGATSIRQFGAPSTWHRGDLHQALIDQVLSAWVHRGRKMVGVEVGSSTATLKFADGSAQNADLVIASDCVHSPGARRAVRRAATPGCSTCRHPGSPSKYRAVAARAPWPSLTWTSRVSGGD